jgi:hypothetical protein
VALRVEHPGRLIGDRNQGIRCLAAADHDLVAEPVAVRVEVADHVPPIVGCARVRCLIGRQRHKRWERGGRRGCRRLACARWVGPVLGCCWDRRGGQHRAECQGGDGRG